MQFFLANFHAERLAGTHRSAAQESQAPDAHRELAMPSQDGQDDATLVAAAAR